MGVVELVFQYLMNEDNLSSRLPLILLFVAFILLYFQWKSQALRLKDFPVAGVSSPNWISLLRARVNYIQGGYELVFKAFDQYPNEIFEIPTPQHNLLVLPPKYVDELKSQPETVMSSSHAVTDYFMGTYTTLDIPKLGHTIWDVIRNRLTQSLNDLVEVVTDECTHAFEEEWPMYDDWEAITVHNTMLQIVGRITGRVFVGESLGRNSEWLHTSIDFATCIFQGSALLKVVPWMVRPMAALFNPYLYRIVRHHRKARKLILPEILRRRASAQKHYLMIKEWDVNTKYERPRDMLTWLEDVSSEAELDPQSIINRQMGMSFAAIHTTSNHLTNVLFDLAARWDEYASEIREEIDQVLGNDNGEPVQKNQITKLSKLDSFMKESQRLNPPSALSFNRKLMSSHVLSDGTVLPKNCYIAVASGPLAQSSSHHPSPEKFDGFRYHKYRQESRNISSANSHSFATTNLGSLIFGHGRFACPGRFFAGLESKIVLVHILRNYDLRLPPDTSRPKNLIFTDALFPDPSRKIFVRRRKD